ncbi:hypothetical protein [Alkalibacterium sp. 20]|uniref:hypothetical protein n=1 Tax=Alkalibacterium sp. 20 TaxID=1798803 RepID=UPI0009001360|nr:hypothetical protein [Alkalibacterium sp. 20]OJF90989.1 hypothetical protein AX762_11510 [Alkalibacterium sp. 20]
MSRKPLKWQQHRAKQTKDWVRMEMKLHGNTAKELSLKLTGIQNDREMHALIVQSVLSKYAIYHPNSGRPAKTTRLMKNQIEKLMGGPINAVKLTITKSRHNELARSFDYLSKNSGLISFLAKVYWLFGEKEMLNAVQLLVYQSYSFVEFLERINEEENEALQYDFFDFISRFKKMHPDYLNYSIKDWLNNERNLNDFEKKRVIHNIEESNKSNTIRKRDKKAINKSIGRHYRKVSKQKKEIDYHE